MSRTILPIKGSPIMSYTNYAYPLSILFDNPSYDKWIYSNYVNIAAMMDNGEFKIKFLTGDAFGGIKPLNYDKVYDVSEDKDIVGEFCERLSDGWYVFTYLNYRHLNRSTNFVHNIMIHGADTDKREFYASGYSFGRFNKFEIFAIDFSVLEKAFFDKANNHTCIYLKPKKTQEDFLYDNFKIQLKDYVSSSFSLDQIDKYIYNADQVRTGAGVLYEDMVVDSHIKNNYPCGIICSSFLSNSFGDNLEKPYIDLRLFRVYYEHKNMLKRRFRYFRDNNLYDFDISPFVADAEELDRLSNILFNYMIKCKVVGLYPKDVAGKIDAISALEQKLYNSFLEKI